MDLSKVTKNEVFLAKLHHITDYKPQTAFYSRTMAHFSIHTVKRLVHPSIFYTRLIRLWGRGGAGAYPSGHRARGGVHPVQVASPSQGHTETNETKNHARSHSLLRTILETPINLTCMFLDGVR